MGSAQSARGIQPGGQGSAARLGRRIPSRDLPPVLAWPPPGAFPPRRCAATGSGSAWKGPGAKVARGPGRELYSALPPAPRRFPPGPREPKSSLCALSPRGHRLGLLPPPSPRGRGGAGAGSARPRRLGTGPPSPPARLSTGADCPQCAPTASRRPGRGPAHVLPNGNARGLRRCRLPTRPVLKHGPRSLTHARVRGSPAKPRGAMKVRAGARRLRWDPGEGPQPPLPPGAPPARLARPVGEVEHERVR